MRVSSANSCRSARGLGSSVRAREERYVIRGGRAGYERLKVLAAGRAARDRRSSRPRRRRAGMRCIDLGCGSGDVTFELARRVGPAGHATGVDQDEVKLALRARGGGRGQGIATPSSGRQRLRLVEPGAYDVVYCRFLLQHLSRPARPAAHHVGGRPARRRDRRRGRRLHWRLQRARRTPGTPSSCGLFARAREPRRRPADRAQALPALPRGRHPRAAPARHAGRTRAERPRRVPR